MKNIAIFDLDGTLCDSLADLADAVNFGLEKLGYPTHNYEKYKLSPSVDKKFLEVLSKASNNSSIVVLCKFK